MIQRLLPALALALAVGACMSSQSSYDLAPAAPAVGGMTGRSLAVAAIDARPYVLDGTKPAEFIGTDRGQYSNTVDVVIASGRPLAAEVTDLAVSGYAARGITAAAVALPAKADEAAMLAAARGQGERLVAVTIREWRTDAYTRVKLTWNLEAAVYDGAGTLLGRSAIQGAVPIGVTSLEADSSGLAGQELSNRLAQLLNERRITDALR